MIVNKLYTFLVEFRGGTYCSQVEATSLDESIDSRIKILKVDKNQIKYLGDKIIKQLENGIKNLDYKPVLLDGLKNIWFTHYTTSTGRFSIHIIKTEKN